MSRKKKKGKANGLANRRTELAGPTPVVRPGDPRNPNGGEAIVHASRQTITAWTSPLPPPEELAKYEQVIPGFTERLMLSWEAEQDHRRSVDERDVAMDEQEQRNHFLLTRSGMRTGLCVHGMAFAAVICALFLGNGTAAVAIASVDVAGWVGALIWGKSKRPPARPPS